MKFSCIGEIGNGSVTLRSHSNVDKPELNVEIDLSEPVALTFSLKYLVNFCKASALSSTVKLCLSNEVPLLVEYEIAGSSYLRFYLAPKVRHPGDSWNIAIRVLTCSLDRLETRSRAGRLKEDGVAMTAVTGETTLAGFNVWEDMFSLDDCIQDKITSLCLSFDWRLSAIGREIETCRTGLRALGNRGTPDGNIFAPTLQEGQCRLGREARCVFTARRQTASKKHGTEMAPSLFMYEALSKVRLRIEA